MHDTEHGGMHMPVKKKSGKLNVVLHGMMAIVVGDEDIKLLIPQIVDHVFLAGNWRQERRLIQDEKYKLSGVDGQGKAQQKLTKEALTVRGFRKKIDPDAQNLFCSIVLPFPDDVHHFRMLTAGKTLKFQGDAADKVENKEGFSLIPVLSYAFENVADLKLVELRWFPEMKDGFVNLHIFSEPLTREVTAHHAGHGTTHVEEAFKNLVALFPRLDLKLTGHGMPLPQTAERTKAGTNIGLGEDEQDTLPERNAENENESTGGPQPFDSSNCPPLVMD